MKFEHHHCNQRQVPVAVPKPGRKTTMRFCALIIGVLVTGLFLTACARHEPNFVKRYDQPLTYSQAIQEKQIDFPFPPSSHGIYFGVCADGQAYTMIARFQAPVQDCVSQIDIVTAWDDKIEHRTNTYPRITVTNVAPQDAGWLGTASWFRPDTITHGIYVGKNASHTPQIWVDLDRGVFYYMETD